MAAEMANPWRWYRGLVGREQTLATAFLAIILGTLPGYAFGLALLFATPSPSGAAAPPPTATAGPTAASAATVTPPPAAVAPNRSAPVPAAPAAKPQREPEPPGRGARGNARGHAR